MADPPRLLGEGRTEVWGRGEGEDKDRNVMSDPYSQALHFLRQFRDSKNSLLKPESDSPKCSS